MACVLHLTGVADFFAHSNYTELALLEMGERDIFPFVGRDTLIRLEGARGSVYPLVTGTFGGVDFLHSVTGEGELLVYLVSVKRGGSLADSSM